MLINDGTPGLVLVPSVSAPVIVLSLTALPFPFSLAVYLLVVDSRVYTKVRWTLV